MNSTKYIRQTMKVERTPRDKGWRMTIVIDAYDDGLVNINGTVANGGSHAHTWVGINRTIADMIELFVQDKVNKQPWTDADVRHVAKNAKRKSRKPIDVKLGRTASV
jgi:hypothetical protein